VRQRLVSTRATRRATASQVNLLPGCTVEMRIMFHMYCDQVWYCGNACPGYSSGRQSAARGGWIKQMPIDPFHLHSGAEHLPRLGPVQALQPKRGMSHQRLIKRWRPRTAHMVCVH
jgi:hypothetical protein